ncbi:hypothetical protein [Chitinophaga solisilvae]|uniref:Uncharacterized protein n=1 Tax=Chitinophaga solisilvae TaxID=1233460 RepID=A0A9Q5GP78_9BACT|nr:hypothetical protein [Chitinophaga solisilvae]NSL90650.1 hypothetical protein [Chitinophaga solisilvae]
MKTWLYLPLLLLGFILPGCTKTTNEVVIPNKTILQDVPPNKWGVDGNVRYVQIAVPELDATSNQLDGVIVSIARDGTLYELLPEVFDGESYNVIHSSQEKGFVTVELRGANGQLAKPVTKTYRFKIVIIPSSQID